MGGKNSKKDKALVSSKPSVMKFVTLGLPNAGKTSFIYRLKNGEPPKGYLSTIGIDFQILYQNGVKLQAWDYASRGSHRAITRSFYRGSSGIVFMIDSADATYLEENLDYLNYILEDELVSNMTLMVVANKQDLNDAVGPEDIEEKIKEKCKIGPGQTVFVMPMSVTSEDGHSVELAFRLLFKAMMRKGKGKMKSGLIPRAWETAEKDVEDSEIDDDNLEEGDDNGKDIKAKENGQILITSPDKKKSFLNDPIHTFKSLLIH